ncbi:Flp family type IVb pilin [Sphingomonas sp. I4]
MNKIWQVLCDRKGATAIEYGLIAALVAVAAIGGMSALGNSLSGSFDRIANSLSSHI